MRYFENGRSYDPVVRSDDHQGSDAAWCSLPDDEVDEQVSVVLRDGLELFQASGGKYCNAIRLNPREVDTRTRSGTEEEWVNG